MVDELQDPLFRRRDLYSFRKQIQQSMNAVMEELGVSEAGAECRLVGVRRSSQQNMSDVCVVRRNAKWPLSLFAGLLDAITTEIANHPDRAGPHPGGAATGASA